MRKQNNKINAKIQRQINNDLFKLYEDDNIFKYDEIKADQACNLDKIYYYMKNVFNKKDPNSNNVGNHNKNYGHKYNFKTLIDNFNKKIQKLI